MPSHPIHRRILAEQLFCSRRSDEGRRYASAQRCGRVDPNPHQIDAVIFALSRVREGGCILADEVGLGKTIEAGLVMAQLRAEGSRRVLLVAPKALLGQWRQELYTLFGISVIEPGAAADAFDGPGVFLIGREQLGSERGHERLVRAPAFDLCVVDEAHEVFAGIYRRFDRSGHYLEDSPYARTAGRLRSLLRGTTPVLLLTATPLSNSLAELWGLVHYVDPSGTLLGDLPTFRQLFCADDDRTLVPGQAQDLQRRLGSVVQRTLRRQAQEFLSTPFVARRARLLEYAMSPAEQALYDDVTRYLLTPGLCAFAGPNRELLVIGFHRRMASSHRALAQSLSRVAERLRALCHGSDVDAAPELLSDLEEDADDDAAGGGGAPEAERQLDPELGQRAALELALVESFVARLSELGSDAKARALLEVVAALSAPGSAGARKLVIFTESLATQDYLRELLIASGTLGDDEITLFRGQNTSARAREALAVWQEEVGSELAERDRPNADVAQRLALVHEFRQRSRVFISTEAGGKGLNLQFCDTVVNYDLPWNPQRIEQRIGRCHRYGQTRDVTVINFLQRGNAAQRLTFELLSRKLDLFGTVLDASDHVLYEPSSRGRLDLGLLGTDFASEIRRIYEGAQSAEQLEAGLSRLGSALDRRRVELEQARERTASLIETRLDARVRQIFSHLARDLPGHLSALDRDLSVFVRDYLESEGIAYRRVPSATGELFEVPPTPLLPEPLDRGLRFWVGEARQAPVGQGLHLGHPLVRLARDAARRASAERFSVRLEAGERSPLERWRGRTGRLRLVRLSYPGFEPVDRLLPVVAFAHEVFVDAECRDALLGLLQGPLEPAAGLASGVSDEVLEEALEEALFIDEHEVARLEHRLFERVLERLERSVEDRILVLERRRQELGDRLRASERERDGAAGSDARSRAEAAVARTARELEALERELARLQSRQDEGYQQWRRHAYERRYAPPRAEPILEVEFVIG